MINHCSDWMKTAVLTLAAALLFALPSFAGFQEDVARDLGARTATLVAPAGSEWLLDLDAASGVQPGDLFAVISKGSPVVHPVTKQVIGSIDETRALLRITKVKSGYSYAAVVEAKSELRAGDEARRFAGLPAVFWDYAGDGEGVFTQLQGALPELHWQDYAAAQASRPPQPRPLPEMKAGLIFVFNAQGLGVKDHQFQPLRFYRPDQFGRGPAPTAGVTAPAGAGIMAGGAAPAAGTLSGGTPSGGLFSGGSTANWLPQVFGGGSPTGPGGALASAPQGMRGGLIINQTDSREGVWYGPRLEGKPVGVEVGELDGDGKNELVMCFRDRLVAVRVTAGKLEPLAELSFGNRGDALAFDGADLDGNGRLELYVTLAQMNDVVSVGFELQGKQLEQVVKPFRFFLRKVDLGGEGAVLLGQDYNRDDRAATGQDLVGQLFRVTRAGDQLQRGAPLDLPSAVSLYGFLPFEQSGRSLIARLSPSDKLQVLDPAGTALWESNDYFGGSEISFDRWEAGQGGGKRSVFLHPRIEAGPDGTVLVPVNEGNRTFNAFRTFNSSHIKAVVYDGYSLVERWRTKPQGGYLGDFRVADADNDGKPEIVMLVMFSRGVLGLGGSESSALLIYEMQ